MRRRAACRTLPAHVNIKSVSMTIDTGKRTERIQMLKQVFGIVLVVLVILGFYRPIRLWLNGFGLDAWLLTCIFAACYLGYRLYFRIRKTSYIYVSDTALPGIIRIRYFEIKPLNPNQFSIEIPQKELYRYEVSERRWGMLEELTLWQRRGTKIFKYPPFSLTLLKRKERVQLVAMLKKYSVKG